MQLGEHFKDKNAKGLDTYNKGGIMSLSEPNKKIILVIPRWKDRNCSRKIHNHRKNIAILTRPRSILSRLVHSGPFLGEDVVVRLFVQLSISSPGLLCYSLVDMCVKYFK